ncbi:MAG TPA: gamma-glutamylcyclotransferase [Polyangiaceae bacterium]|nr:gamma-glutamylcyclotransferase [Polyangiaceae bacterium]
MMRERVFVYGSLMQGLEHHEEMRGAQFEGTCRTVAGFFLALQGRYPALVRGGATVVHGESYLVTAAQLARLDVFEGCPGLYQRERISLDDGGHRFAYLIDAERGSRLPRVGSCWRGWVRPSPP